MSSNQQRRARFFHRVDICSLPEMLALPCTEVLALLCTEMLAVLDYFGARSR
ncbi:MAG: hypothetical protein GY820_03220 [Gammaproteobacteria bacterium]|nr:hypothetical protein [Gammaproteobacteria bacterium]